MSDISASEQRLVAALDRIDRSLERRIGSAGTDEAALRAENARLVAAIAGLQDEAARAAEAVVAASEAGGESRLAAANDDLAAANRALIDAAEGRGEVETAATAALRAEIAALQALRATEMAQMGGILDAIEGLLAAPADLAEEEER